MTVHQHLERVAQALAANGPRMADVTERWGLELAVDLRIGRRLLAAGNGGSAAQAQHLTAELVGRYCSERRPFSALALHAETSSVTAIANDYGYHQVFARQVLAHGRDGDTLLLLSTSGRSANLLTAAEAGTSAGLRVLAMTGPGPNPLLHHVDEALAVEAPDAAAVQELHLVAVHMLCESFDLAIQTQDDVLPDTVSLP